ncbi:hypothetical protein C2W62_01105 [Candidatus Entotheonella serta]|nr:hypothetical protein C2W62_01105 [Candidatus Entotheonella serta]
MPTYLVENYVVRYDLDQNRPWLIFHYKEGSQWRNVNWFPPKEDAQYLTDMLRNEKPIYYVETGSGAKWLTTSAEEIGEEES